MNKEERARFSTLREGPFGTAAQKVFWPKVRHYYWCVPQQAAKKKVARNGLRLIWFVSYLAKV
jgi:hypothetical protein